MKTTTSIALIGVLFLASCAQDSMTGDTYSRYEARQSQTVNMGRILSIRSVMIEGEHEAGTLIGGLAGGIMGSTLGQGRASNTAGALGGALLGSAIGSQVEKGMSSRRGIEITVRLDNGNTVSVVQQVNPREAFYEGDRVRVLNNGSQTRVTH